MDYKDYTEIISKRTAKGSTFDKGNGKHCIVISQHDVHYTDDGGNFRTIDCSIENNKVEVTAQPGYY